ncbi:DUF6893 family small protein [Streptomyces phaeofaciens]
MKKVIVGSAVLVVAAVVAEVFPDIRRYLRIRRM